MSDLLLVIGNCNYSSWSLRPWLFLAHHGIDFELKRVSLFTESMEPDLKPYFSDNKVPVLLDQGREIWDSLAILEYLAERFTELNGWPEDAGARGVARSVSAEMHSSFPDLRNEMPMNCRRRFVGFKPSDAAHRDIQRVLAIWKACRTRFGEGGPWLFGQFSVADCMFAPVVMRLIGYQIPLDEIGSEYANTLYGSSAARDWIERGKGEPEVIEEDEAPFPSEAI
ncbi:MAG: glutathione S-transferase [Gammaproteobacteria bacterium]|nr:glutathione S-transferase [Gammaproteobacteria bacterium]